MERSLNGKKKYRYVCFSRTEIHKDENGRDKPIFVKGCGFSFSTCGKPQFCPKCHTPLPTDRSVKA